MMRRVVSAGLLMLSSVLVAQQALVINPANVKSLPKEFIPEIRKELKTNTRAAEWNILIDHAPDINQYGLGVFPLNTNFGCQEFYNYDEGNFNNPADTFVLLAGFTEWRITQLVNADSGIVYPFDLNTACISYHIDSLQFIFTYFNPAQIPDTLIIELFKGSQILWADSIYNLFTIVSPATDDLLDTLAILTVPVNFSLDTPPGIVGFRFKYYSQKDSAAFGFIYGLKDPNSCNNQCFVSDADIDFPNNFAFLFKYAPAPSLCNNVFTNDPNGAILAADCNGSGTIDASACELFGPAPIVWAYGKLRTINYPPFLDADIQTDDNTRWVCAGQAINVEATAGFDSYTWSGTGASGNTNIGTINIPPASVTSNPDTFIITVTGQGAAIGCSASDQLTVVAYNAPPIANFVLNATPGDPTITVDNTSLYGVSCIWDWGDGNLSTSCEPFAYTYGSLGEYTITLIVSNPCGADTIKRSAVLTSNPIAASASLTYFHRNNTVVIEGLPAQTTHILFTDAMGRTIRTVPVSGKNVVEIEIGDLPSQMYNVVIIGQEGRLGMFRLTK